MPQKPQKPTALVTGANQGIGLQIAKELLAHGFTVLIGSRNLQRGETAAAQLGPHAHALQLDVADPASIAAAAERIRRDFQRLDVLVQNAAITNTSRLPRQSVEDYAHSTRPRRRTVSPRMDRAGAGGPELPSLRHGPRPGAAVAAG